jgi:hypothetical protein
MPEPTILTALRARPDPDSNAFCRHYDRLKELTTLKFERALTREELAEIALLRNLVRQSLALWLEKR